MAQDTAPSRTTETDDQQAGSLGLVAATAIVMGSIVGTGAFTLPISLAPYGAWLAILSFIVATIGALALAQVFGRLARRLPFGGGPYIYAWDAFGEPLGLLLACAY